MESSDKAELNSIISELRDIVNELDDISYGVRHDFAGIDNERCANGISKVADLYGSIRTRLRRSN